MSCQILNETTINSHRDFLDSFDYILTDCDGVLWLNDTEIPGASKALRHFRNCGKKMIFVTNNSTKSVDQYKQKFEKLNMEAHPDEVFPTSYCAALYLQSVGFDRKVYLMASKGTSDEFDKARIKYLPIGSDPFDEEKMAKDIANKTLFDPEVGAVVVGFDPHISYVKLTKAATYLRDPKCLFVGTNTDEQFPFDNSSVIIPGTGVMVKAVETASCRKAVVVGKPEKFMFECIKEVHPNIDANRCLMIGDRLNTDILFGHNIGAKTLLVLSGVTPMAEVEQLQKDSAPESKHLLPDFIVTSLGELVALL